MTDDVRVKLMVTARKDENKGFEPGNCIVLKQEMHLPACCLKAGFEIKVDGIDYKIEEIFRYDVDEGLFIGWVYPDTKMSYVDYRTSGWLQNE